LYATRLPQRCDTYAERRLPATLGLCRETLSGFVDTSDVDNRAAVLYIFSTLPRARFHLRVNTGRDVLDTG